MPRFQTSPDPPDDGLALTVGCTFELQSTIAVAAVMQVAPGPDPRVRIATSCGTPVRTITATWISTATAASA